MHKVNWDDLRFVLAVADHGSVSGAARALGVTHATVLRRIAAFEEAAGTPVFERLAHGYRLRPDRADVIEAAREAANRIDRVEALMRGSGGGGAGDLRLTTVDSLACAVIPAVLPKLAAAVAPGRVVLLVSNDHLDMARLQADIALRPAPSLPDDMTGEVALHMSFGCYGAPGLAADAPWLGLAGTTARAPVGRWMAENLPQDRIGPSASSFVALREMARAGLGAAILPDVLGQGADGLEPLARDMPQITVPVWVACHRDLDGIPRLDKARAALTSALRGLRKTRR
jgi:DNA-binding transcriptional LysR family regulator